MSESAHQNVGSLPRIGRKRINSVRCVNKMEMSDGVHRKHRRKHHDSVRSADSNSSEDVSGVTPHSQLRESHSTDHIPMGRTRCASSGDIDLKGVTRCRHNSILSEPSLVPESIPDFSVCDHLMKLSKLFAAEKSQDRICSLCNSKCREKFYFIGGYYFHAKCVKCSRCRNSTEPPFKVIDSKSILCASCIEKAMAKSTERPSLLVEKEEKKKSKRSSRYVSSSNADSE